MDNLKSEFLEEPLVLAGLVSFFEGGFDVGLGGSFFGGVFEAVFVDDFLVDWDVNRVSGWHNVVVVDDLDESLHLVSASDLLFAHGFGDLPWVSVDTGDQSVSVKSVLGTFVGLLDDNGFSAGVFAGSDDNYSSGFDESSHIWF